MTFDLDDASASTVTAAADWRGMTVSEYLYEVASTDAKMDADMEAFVQEGIDSADRGELIDRAEEAWFEAHRAAAAE